MQYCTASLSEKELFQSIRTSIQKAKAAIEAGGKEVSMLGCVLLTMPAADDPALSSNGTLIATTKQ